MEVVGLDNEMRNWLHQQNYVVDDSTIGTTPSDPHALELLRYLPPYKRKTMYMIHCVILNGVCSVYHVVKHVRPIGV